MTTTYEWKLELSDEHGDILDALHFEEAELDLAIEHSHSGECSDYAVSICLVRDVGNDLDGLTDRQHAYIENGELPDSFEYGTKIPARFYEMVKRAYQ